MPNLVELEKYLNDFNIAYAKADSLNLSFALNVTLLSGRRQLFNLKATQDNERLLIKENNGNFPCFCPNRHINSGGYFCLGLEVDDLKILDWISYVKEYLRAQAYVNKHRKWPKNIKEWSHGNAAEYQKLVEDSLKLLSANNLSIDFKKIKLVRAGRNKQYPNQCNYHLYYDSDLIATGVEGKVLNKRASCICITDGSGRHRHKTIGSCKHQCTKVLYQIPFNEKRRVSEEDRFWRDCDNESCCMTMDECKLK